ncbi:MAG: acyltransferase family protein [Acidimicrobiales bacterium]
MDTPALDTPTAGPTTTEEPPAEPVTSAATPRVIVPALDGFRGLAALTVVLYHVFSGAGLPPLGNTTLRDVLESGYVGVDFFFVISGFVLFLPTVLAGGRFGNVRAYGIRRAARIVPAYYMALIAAVILQPLLNVSRTDLPWDGQTGIVTFLLHLSFLQHSVGLLRGYTEGFLVLGVIWTLTLEATFYVVLPLIASWYYRHPFVGFAIALVASVGWKLTVVHASFSVGWLRGTDPPALLRLILVTQFPTFLAHFAAGMTAAWLFVRWRTSDKEWLPWAAVAMQIAAVAVILWGMQAAGHRDMTATGGVYDHWTKTLAMALAFAVLVLATVLAPARAQSPFTNRAARALGDISYGVYLWHTLIIGFALVTLGFSYGATTSAFLSMLAITSVGSIAIATLSLVFVERPCIRWARRCSRRIERNDRRRHAAGLPPGPAGPAGPAGPEKVEAVNPVNAW